MGLHSTIDMKKDMLVELCASNYATFDSLVNEIDGIFKISIRYCEKIIIWIMFQISKIRTQTREKYSQYYDNYNE